MSDATPEWNYTPPRILRVDRTQTWNARLQQELERAMKDLMCYGCAFIELPDDHGER